MLIAPIGSHSSRGEVNIQTTAPDSITSWQATAFALNDQSGFGLSKEPAKVTIKLIIQYDLRNPGYDFTNVQDINTKKCWTF